MGRVLQHELRGGELYQLTAYALLCIVSVTVFDDRLYEQLYLCSGSSRCPSLPHFILLFISAILHSDIFDLGKTMSKLLKCKTAGCPGLWEFTTRGHTMQ